VLGVSGELGAELEALVRREGVADRVTLSGYVSDDELREAMLGARLLVLPSTFEGFGIPIVEAMALGVPVVIGPDPGAVETAGGHASVMAEWSVSALVDALTVAMRLDGSATDAARRHADQFTWANAVRGTRTFLAEAADRGSVSARSRSRGGSDPAASR
jgi:glycosyltransferase involved in cell wall biosynthesis